MILFVLLFFSKVISAHHEEHRNISFQTVNEIIHFLQWHIMDWIVCTKFICFTDAQDMALYVFQDTIEKTYSCTWVGGSLIPWDYIVKHVETWGIVDRRKTPLKLEVKIKVNRKSRKTKDCQKTPENKRTAWKRIFTRSISESMPDSVIIISGVCLQNCFN